jgi:hypothetical protein
MHIEIPLAYGVPTLSCKVRSNLSEDLRKNKNRHFSGEGVRIDEARVRDILGASMNIPATKEKQ